MSPEREFLWPFGSLMPYRAPEVEPLPAMPVLPGDIWLMIAGRRLSLTETTHLTVRDIPCLAAPAADGIVAEVREHPDDPSLLVLRNLSNNIWQAVLPDGAVRTIEPAGTVRLIAGTRIVFGTQAGVILVTSTEIGANPRAHAEEEWCYCVTPAKAGAHVSAARAMDIWVLVFAGMAVGDYRKLARLAFCRP